VQTNRRKKERRDAAQAEAIMALFTQRESQDRQRSDHRRFRAQDILS
jgi:hypothetical protein